MRRFINMGKATESPNVERAKLRTSLFMAGLLAVLLLLAKGIETCFDVNLSQFGIYPRHTKGLAGIVFAPFIHGNWSHLWSNLVPLLFLSSGLLYFFRNTGILVLCLLWLITGLSVWGLGRESYHIGASGVVYGLATFMAFSGVLRNHLRLLAMALLVVFLYGSMFWGVLPIFERISWESHLMGSITGVVLAVYFRNEGPKTQPYFDEQEEEIPEWYKNLYPEPVNETESPPKDSNQTSQNQPFASSSTHNTPIIHWDYKEDKRPLS